MKFKVAFFVYVFLIISACETEKPLQPEYDENTRKRINKNGKAKSSSRHDPFAGKMERYVIGFASLRNFDHFFKKSLILQSYLFI